MLIIFFFGLLIPPIWLSVHVLRRKSWPFSLRLILVLLLFLISQKFTLNRLLFGTLTGPDMPEELLLAQACALTCEVLCFFCVAAVDIFSFLLRRVRCHCSREGASDRSPGKKSDFDPDRRRFLARSAQGAIALSVPLSCLGTAALGVHNGVAVPTVRASERTFKNLPSGLSNLKICLISDLHVGPLTSVSWMEQTVALVNACKPDLICIAGDLSDGLLSYTCPDGSQRKDVAEKLSGLSAPLGVWACTGNHEYYSDYRGWMALYHELGIVFLRNRGVVLERKGASLVLAGRDDKQAQRFGYGPAVSCAEVFKGLPGHRQGAFRLVLDHRPERAEENASSADLQLSGHTHGGQCLGMERLVAMANQNMVRGWYERKGMPVYVSNGAGLWSGFPVRIGVPAEVALITLQGQA